MDSLVAFCKNAEFKPSNITIDVDKIGLENLYRELTTLNNFLSKGRISPDFKTYLYTKTVKNSVWYRTAQGFSLVPDRDNVQDTLTNLGKVYINNAEIAQTPNGWAFTYQSVEECTVEDINFFSRENMRAAEPIRERPQASQENRPDQGFWAKGSAFSKPWAPSDVWGQKSGSAAADPGASIGQQPSGASFVYPAGDDELVEIENFQNGAALLGQLCKAKKGKKTINIASKCPIPVSMFTTEFVQGMLTCHSNLNTPFFNFTNLVMDIRITTAEQFGNLRTHYKGRRIEQLTVVVVYNRGNDFNYADFKGIDTDMADDFSIQIPSETIFDAIRYFCQALDLSKRVKSVIIDATKKLTRSLFEDLRQLSIFLKSNPNDGFITRLYYETQERVDGQPMTWYIVNQDIQTNSPKANCQEDSQLKNIGDVYINNAKVEKSVSNGCTAWTFKYHKPVVTCTITSGKFPPFAIFSKTN
jgi:hypothetical protein